MPRSIPSLKSAKHYELNLTILKKRIERHKALSISSTPPAPRFIEMGVSQIASESECTIEVQRCDGTRMRMSVRGALDPHLIEMARAFWSRP